MIYTATVIVTMEIAGFNGLSQLQAGQLRKLQKYFEYKTQKIYTCRVPNDRVKPKYFRLC